MTLGVGLLRQPAWNDVGGGVAEATGME
jgi:hypothetical protein